jgi:hypothetical protein
MNVSCDSAAAMFDCDVPPIRLGPVPGEPGFFFTDTREALAGPLWGQKQTWRALILMSALTPKADID